MVTEPVAGSRRLIDVDTKLRAAIGRGMERWLADQRAAKISWMDVAYEIRRLTEVRVTHETLPRFGADWGID